MGRDGERSYNGVNGELPSAKGSPAIGHSVEGRPNKVLPCLGFQGLAAHALVLSTHHRPSF